MLRHATPHAATIGAGLVLAVALSTPATASWSHDPYQNDPVSTVSGDQRDVKVTGDGSGGCYVSWTDYRNDVAGDIYLTHLEADGSLAPGWTAGGDPVAVGTQSQTLAVLAPDGVGGVFVAWQHYGSPTYTRDIYLQHVDPSGTIHGGWPASGLAVAATGNDDMNPSILADGTSGVYVVWQYQFGANDIDLYGTRITAAGAPASGFTANNVALASPLGNQIDQDLALDSQGNLIVVWDDDRNVGTNGWDVYAQKLLSTGSVLWGGTDGSLICDQPADQRYPKVTTDGGAGGFVAWQDFRAGLGSDDVYGTRVLSNGSTAFPTGFVVSAATALQQAPRIVSDGVGGAIVAWTDTRAQDGSRAIYAQRIQADGSRVWGASDLAISTVPGIKGDLRMVSDGAGGATLTWDNLVTAYTDVYAQHVGSTGVPSWTSGGTPVSLAAYDQNVPDLEVDADGSTIIAWVDYRLDVGGVSDLFAGRVDPYGDLGDPSPVIAGVQDVPNDQGGEVKVSWASSFLDDGSNTLDRYQVWRSVPPASAKAALASGAALVAAAADAPEGARPVYTTTIEGGATYYWELVGTQPAAALAAYSLEAPTTSDSIGTSNPFTAFMVQAVAYDARHWESGPDSGYSVDNLAPLTPSPLTATYSAGTTTLHWGANSEADLAGYRLYRGSTADFTPDATSLLAAVTDTGYVDVAGAAYYYKLSAVDVHGNESGYAEVLPTGAVGAPGAALPREVALEGARPNPARGGARIGYALPRAGEVRLELYDVAGREVRVLARGEQVAGKHAVAWDGRDDGGRVLPAGLYVLRLEAEGRVLTRRLAEVN